MIWYLVLILATGVERITEVRISNRHAAWAFERGGKEFGQRHFPWMVALHTALLLGALAEVFLLDRPFIPWLGWPMLVIALACQAGRYWVIWALGNQWNTRVIVVPGLPRVVRGPYRYSWLRHPNYVIVAIEGIALPLVYTAWITAIAFTVLNAILLLRFRIPTEDRALTALTEADTRR
ncbi:isoprenylcysteine carboxyl methyltransferase family protein [Glaciihabitans sp. dw_435]|uniref:isoprenylcysteine carboxyl methyltransferase family protein n=1 Tax=Glaciihabitans sp. dw_435 TaxID=2720081 RepID=UPI001BD6A38B|nr:isoprenylcysteine carboxylmethyltransferase family protein [Glaciihabitans sp. dw_435]